MKKVLVLINPKSGTNGPYRFVAAIQEVWDTPEHDLSFQFSQSAQDGKDKVKRAIANGVDTVLVVGGDGMVNSIGPELMHTSVKLGVIPAGSGNGFARHFETPLSPKAAALALFNGTVQTIDVGQANDRFFFITCSMAWDGALVEAFEKIPFRGLTPYIIAGTQQFIEYKAQPFHVEMDSKEINLKQPMIFTVANLTQFGSDFLVAPEAKADSGSLNLIAVEKKDIPAVISQLNRLIEKSYHQHPLVVNETFKEMTVHRTSASPIQIDGELMKSEKVVQIKVIPRVLNVIAPTVG